MQCSVAEIVPWSRAMGGEWEVVVEAAALRYRLIRDNVWHQMRQQLKDWLRRKQWTKAKRTKVRRVEVIIALVVVIVVMHTPKRSKSSRQMLMLMVAIRMLECLLTFPKAVAIKMPLFPAMTRSWLRKVSRLLQ